MKNTLEGIKSIFTIVAKPNSYLNILYLLLAFPLGIFYFVYLITGFSIGLGLLYLFIGLPFLLLTMFSWRVFAKFEGLQAQWLLKIKVNHDTPTKWKEANGFWNWITSRLASKYTWKGLAYLLLKAPLGVFSFIVTFSLTTISGVLIIAPFIYKFVDYELPWGAISTMPQALSLTAAGLIIGLLSLHIFNGLAAVFRWLSKNMLDVQPHLAVSK